MPGVQETLGHPRPLRPLLHDERLPVDRVLHHRQHRAEVLRHPQHVRRLDLHDLHDTLHPLHLPRFMAHRQAGE